MDQGLRMVDILRELTVKVLGHVLPFFVGWYYKPTKLAKKIKIQVRGADDGVVFECGELPHVQAWLEITNLSPFPIEIDRLHGHFWYGTRLAPFYFLKRIRVGPSQDTEILLEADLTRSQADYIKKNKTHDMEIKLSISAYVVCKVNNFDIELQIRTNNTRLLNA